MTESNAARLHRAKLLAFCGLMLLTGFLLAVAAGPPRLPAVPTPEAIVKVLGGTSIPVESLLPILVDMAWVLWGWIVLSLVLELALMVADILAQGSEVVRALRVVVDRLSMPLVRRGVAAAFAVQIISRGVPIAAAQSLPPVDVETVRAVEAADAARGADVRSAGPTYIVQAGDTLWLIAERAYGSGTEYRRLVEANVGRSMRDGEVFSARGVIKPGWQLVAPGATWEIQDDSGQSWYTVRPGDTLSSIASMTLGDRSRWTELFELNRGAATPDGLHTLEEANTIWPGLRLQVPVQQSPASAPEPDAQPSTATVEPDPVELLAASAPAEVAQVEPTVAPEPPAAPVAGIPTDVPPLVRTPHALQPVVLDPADGPDISQAPSGGASEPTGQAQASVPGYRRLPSEVPVLPLALGGLGLAGIAGAAITARRRRLRPLPKEPESEVVVSGGFAEAQLAHDLTRGLHGIGFDPVDVLVGRLERFLGENDLANVGVVAVRHGRSSTTITLRCGLADQSVLLDLASQFAEQLDADVEACVSTDQDVLLRLVRLRKTRLLPAVDRPEANTCLVPLGVLYDRQIYSATWQALGHVLVISMPGHGADTILTSLVATLTSRRSPEQMRIWMVAAPRAVPAPLLELPHVVRHIDPADSSAVAVAIENLRAELEARALTQSVADVLVVVPDLASLGESAAELALIASRAAELGVRMVVGCSDPDEAFISPLTPHLTTRMVMRMESEEASVALLGVADAAFLAAGGRLLLRLDGREPVELYGYQIANEHLERLVKIMRSAYPASADEELPPLSGRVVEPSAGETTDTHASAVIAEPERSAPTAGASEIEAEQGDAPHESSECGERSSRAVLREVAPPIRITCFGSPRVTCGDQIVWPRSGGDAKPWELLFFIACQPADGVTRANVIEALWPEEDLPDEGGHRFRQLRYRLRRQLQTVPGAPETDGVCLDRRQLRIDPAIVYSDAQEFLEHIRAARVNPGNDAIERLERARGLYVGDLLEGPDVRRYAWIDERDDSGVTLREHFRRLFQNASIRLAELYSTSGELELAIELYRELTELDPADERLWQALFRLHAQRGDRNGLIGEEQRLRRMLRELAEELDEPPTVHALEPGRETSEEFQRLLSGLHQREPATV